MDWVHQQRRANVSWAAMAQGASFKGCLNSEGVLRTHHKRCREKQVQADAPTG
jgi:hypothetical protein